MSSLSACRSARSKSEIRGLKTSLICLSFLRGLRRVFIALICLINDRGDIATFSAFARSSTHITLPFVSHIYCHYLRKISPFLTLGKPLYLVLTLYFLYVTSPLSHPFFGTLYLLKSLIYLAFLTFKPSNMWYLFFW